MLFQDPTRTRKLLLKQRELANLYGQINRDGLPPWLPFPYIGKMHGVKSKLA